MSESHAQTIYVSTIIDTFNYGTVMQALATKILLSHYGRPVFIDYCRPQWTPNGHRELCLEKSGNLIKKELKYILTVRDWDRQRAMFRTFIEHELELCDAAPFRFGGEFDNNAIYCVGSDQTWNFEDNSGLDPVYFLRNVPDSCKKIAFSASFGRERLGETEAKLTKQALEKFDAISVRERSSIKILDSLGLRGTALTDPVLMCDSSLWKNLAKGTSRSTHPYLLVYRLNQNDLMVEYAIKLAKLMELDTKIITFTKKQSLAVPKGTHAVLLPSPDEWLSMFRDAEYVVTDSFHGTCFSLLFERPMTVFDPPKYSVRLRDILNDFGLRERRVPFGSELATICIHRNSVDWDMVQGVRSEYKRKAKTFLDDCLGDRQ